MSSRNTKASIIMSGLMPTFLFKIRDTLESEVVKFLKKM
jgi:hypothetical protein